MKSYNFGFRKRKKYNFPYSLLSNGSGDSIRCLFLAHCSFHPTAEVGLLRSLTRLYLKFVRITGDELGSLLSNSLALEQVEIVSCDKIVCMKIPNMLHRLSFLKVEGCDKLKLIDSEAPNITRFCFAREPSTQLSLGESLQMKNLLLLCDKMVFYTRVHLPLSMPNLETLDIVSHREVANTTIMPSKFLHLKQIMISFASYSFNPAYDYVSLASFIDACPSLEFLDLNVKQRVMKHVSIFEDTSEMRHLREQQHHNLKYVRIVGFTSAKSLIELTCHVIGSATSLEWLSLEPHHSGLRCSERESGKCTPLPMNIIVEAHRGLLAIRKYIEPKVPPTVKLQVVELCSCHPSVP
ncbi:hypothetical protein ACP4OV_014427 [Aristida adscensionis]